MDDGGFMTGGVGYVMLAIAGLGTAKVSVILPAMAMLALGF